MITTPILGDLATRAWLCGVYTEGYGLCGGMWASSNGMEEAACVYESAFPLIVGILWSSRRVSSLFTEGALVPCAECSALDCRIY